MLQKRGSHSRPSKILLRGSETLQMKSEYRSVSPALKARGKCVLAEKANKPDFLDTLSMMIRSCFISPLIQ